MQGILPKGTCIASPSESPEGNWATVVKAKSRYALPVLELVAPKMRRGAIVVNHNAAVVKGDHAEYVVFVRDPANGFVYNCPKNWATCEMKMWYHEKHVEVNIMLAIQWGGDMQVCDPFLRVVE